VETRGGCGVPLLAVLLVLFGFVAAALLGVPSL
jgi:hypothetical protein